MNWIKVTPETMPPDMDPVMVTVRHTGNFKSVYVDARYNAAIGRWQFEYGGNYINFDSQVTHWAFWPKPAED